MKSRIINCINESIKVKELVLTNSDTLNNIEEIVVKSVEAFNADKKMLLCGNGGSASDSIHIAAELVGKFEKERKGLPAIALSANQSNITSIGNDYGFENIFARQIEAIGQQGDILIGLSTSGNSKNIVQAINMAQSMKIDVIALTGINGGEVSQLNALTLKIQTNTNKTSHSNRITHKQ
mgnify:CR=1 FL=1